MQARRLFSFDSLLTTVLTVCAIVMTTIVVRRPDGGLVAPTTAERPHRVNAAIWRALIATGHWVGPPHAAVTVVEFGDFQCPYCGAFAVRAIPSLVRRYPGEVALVYHYMPLAYHQQAYPAARAAECAAHQGRFAAFYALLYREQDSLGRKPFGRFAEEAGIPDSAQFTQCDASGDSVAAIASDLALARRIGARVTPTLVINGTMWVVPPDSARLDSIVSAAVGTTTK